MTLCLLAQTTDPGYGTLAALVLFIAASVWLGALAQRIVQKSSFVQGYFLGNRGLGAWALALTATVQSGGTFMGFPSLVYSYGWVVALWIASYMVVPLTNLGVLGKRIAIISRKSGAVTMPDLFRARFASPTAGLVASLLIMLFMTFMMIAQFKAGAIVMKNAWPGSGVLSFSEEGTIDRAYFVGLAIFSCTVIGYTLIGGFLAAVWTDLFQSVMMFIGVLFLLFLVVPMAGGLSNATTTAVAHTDPSYALGPGYSADGRAFLPLTLAFSFFCFWPFAGMASPATVVRIMAVKDTRTLRKSIFLLCVYNLGIYLPLIVICICARAIMPDLGGKSDEVIPRITLLATKSLPGGSFIAGMILAAPFGAVMATVSSYLVVIASGLVRDIYQRFIDPDASEHTVRRLSYFVMIFVGVVAVVANIRPPGFLQTFVVFSSGSAASAFLAPTFMLCYWRRATAAGVISAMLAGAGASVALFALGMFTDDPLIGPEKGFRPYYLMGFDPIVWGLAMSVSVGTVVSWLTPPPPAELVEKYFEDAEPTAG
jgi:SSS family solute:Na+ symporter/sodium/pantothenate symporter